MRNYVWPILFGSVLFYGNLFPLRLEVALAGDLDLYQSKVAPLLKEKCTACHGAVRQEAGLRLDAAEMIRKGSGTGSIVDLEKPSESELLRRVCSESADERMPPPNEGVALKSEEIELLRSWLEKGMPSPESEEVLTSPREHWSFRPIPRNTDGATIDSIVSSAHSTRNLEPLPEADRYTLLRRVTLDLTGLPPTREEIDQFISDTSEDAYQRTVDRLLSRPSYGERWGRHWMDVWRYSDWDGYKEELRGSQRHIWHWRDWIIESLNANKPYDQMVREMIAADELYPLDSNRLRATGFLARNYHKSNRNIWLDATIEHTSKAFLGLTINCAKCHDHKYDPISQEDYYRFRAIFEPHQVRTDAMHSSAELPSFPRAYDADPNAMTYIFSRGDDKHPIKEKGMGPGMPYQLPVDIPFEVSAVDLPAAAYLPELTAASEKAELEKAWKRIDEANDKLSNSLAKARQLDLGQSGSDALNNSEAIKLELLKLREAEAALTSLKARFAADKAKHLTSSQEEYASTAKTARELEQQWKMVEAELRLETASRGLKAAENSSVKDEKKRQQALDKAKKELEEARTKLQKYRNNDESVQLKDYTTLVKGYPKTTTGRRAALARWITDQNNPLAARVAVNHVWARHFGSPLVDSVFDFGLKSSKPQLMEVLDLLAGQLVASQWDLKKLHRSIVTSDAYRRASDGTPKTVAHNRGIDPDNQLYWRYNVSRLDAEVIRDGLLLVGGILEGNMGGPDIDEDSGEKVFRRSIYFRHAYEKQMTMMVLFDAASPSECYLRKPSVIPQQALVMANSDLTRTVARKLAEHLRERSHGDRQRFVDDLFLTVLGRPVLPHESSASLNFLSRSAGEGNSNEDSALQSLSHVLLNHSDFVSVR